MMVEAPTIRVGVYKKKNTMNAEEQKQAISGDLTAQLVRKIYQTPVIKAYGSINDLVQAGTSTGRDAGSTDDASASA